MLATCTSIRDKCRSGKCTKETRIISVSDEGARPSMSCPRWFHRSGSDGSRDGAATDCACLRGGESGHALRAWALRPIAPSSTPYRRPLPSSGRCLATRASRRLYRQGEMDAKTLHLLTLATRERQKAWVQLVTDSEQTPPPFWQLKAWLLGGSEISAKAALFDEALYAGPSRPTCSARTAISPTPRNSGACRTRPSPSARDRAAGLRLPRGPRHSAQ